METSSFAPKLANLKQRIKGYLGENKFYNVYQTYKTIYRRCMQHDESDWAFHYLKEALLLMVQKKQSSSTQDLMKDLLKFTKDRTHLITTDFIGGFVRDFYSACGDNFSSDFGSLREEFIDQLGRIIQSNSAKEENRLLLKHMHQVLGRQLWKEKKFCTLTRTHLIKSGDGFIYGIYLIDIHQLAGFKSELELFVTQAILQCLCLESMPMAAVTFLTYISRHPRISDKTGPPFKDYPLLNFLWLLLIAIDRKLQLSMFYLLCERYHLYLKRDDSYGSYLEKIAVLYFGVMASSSSAGVANNTASSSSENPLLQRMLNIFAEKSPDETLRVEEMD